MQITYIGHATLLLELAGARILTDPNFESKLGRLLPRVSAPGIALEALPKLDAILLTHAHADHLSFKSLDRLPSDIPLYAPPAVARWLVGKGYHHATPLDDAECVTIGAALRVHTGRATHKGTPLRLRPVAQRGEHVPAGDRRRRAPSSPATPPSTPTTHHLVERVLWEQERQLDIALLPIGYAPPWKPGFRRGHLTGDDALTLFETLRARAMLPYHWGTFRHVTATAHDAIDRLRARLVNHDAREYVHVIEPGESLTLGPAARK